MKVKLEEEISEEQAVLRSGKGTRDQILNLKMVIKKNREFNNNVFLCFIDFNKAFDMVSHKLLCNVMIGMGFSAHLIELISNLYKEQKATVRTTHGLTEWFNIEKGRQTGLHSVPTFIQHLFWADNERGAQRLCR